MSGWNKVFENNGNVYYHNKHTGAMQFAPPSTPPDNVPLSRALKLKSFDRVKDSRGMSTRAYPLSEGHYVIAAHYEGVKYIHIGRYVKPGRKLPESNGAGIAMDEGVWEELCRNKNMVTELLSHYHTSITTGVTQLGSASHPEKCRILLGKQSYVRVMVEEESVHVDIRYFDNVLQSVTRESNTEQSWAVTPSSNGITLTLDQWKKMTSLEGLFAIEHLKALAGVPFVLARPSLAKRRKINLKLSIPEPSKHQEEEAQPTQVEENKNSTD